MSTHLQNRLSDLKYQKKYILHGNFAAPEMMYIKLWNLKHKQKRDHTWFYHFSIISIMCLFIIEIRKNKIVMLYTFID